jgi:hypothetical protein
VEDVSSVEERRDKVVPQKISFVCCELKRRQESEGWARLLSDVEESNDTSNQKKSVHSTCGNLSCVDLSTSVPPAGVL